MPGINHEQHNSDDGSLVYGSNTSISSQMHGDDDQTRSSVHSDVDPSQKSGRESENEWVAAHKPISVANERIKPSRIPEEVEEDEMSSRMPRRRWLNQGIHTGISRDPIVHKKGAKPCHLI